MITINEKRGYTLNKNEEVYMKGFRRRKGKGKMLSLKYNLKNKK